MNFGPLFNAIRTRWKAEVADVEGLTTQYQNVKEDKPGDGSLWCRLVILPGRTVRVTVGGPTRTYRTPGEIVAQLFGPIDDGDGDIMALADTVAAPFRSVIASGVEYLTPRVVTVGRDGESYQVNVHIPFTWDVTTTT